MILFEHILAALCIVLGFMGAILGWASLVYYSLVTEKMWLALALTVPFIIGAVTAAVGHSLGYW